MELSQANFTYYPLGKAFKNKQDNWDRGKKQIDAITDQSKRLATLTNKDDDKDNYKKYLKNLLNKDLMKKRINWGSKPWMSIVFKSNLIQNFKRKK